MSLVQAVEQMEEEIANLIQQRDELAAQVEVMREVLIEANNRIQQRQLVGGLVENIERALSITPSAALLEIQARAIEETACWFDEQAYRGTSWSSARASAELREMAAAKRKGE